MAMGRGIISPSRRTLRRSILTVLVVPLAALVACYELPTEPIEPEGPLGHHRPDHAGGGKGGGDEDAPATHRAQVIDAGIRFLGNSAARGVDDSNVVIGYARVDDGSPRAFRWQEGDDDLQLLPTDWSVESSAVGIHDGRIVGWEGHPSVRQGFVYHHAQGTIDGLPALDADECTHSGGSEPFAVAARGVAGRTGCYWIDAEEQYHSLAAAVVWLAGTHELVELPGLPGGSTPRLRDINDKGQVVGTVWKDQAEYVVLWEVSENGVVTGPAVLPYGDLAVPHAISNDGDIVGQIATRDGAQLVTRAGGVLDLQPLHGNDDPVSANALTDRVDGRVLVVGHSGERPVLWTVDAANLEVESVVELELPEGRYKAAYPVAVNSKGVIVGFSNTRPGGRQTSRSHATVWWPVEGTD